MQKTSPPHAQAKAPPPETSDHLADFRFEGEEGSWPVRLTTQHLKDRAGQFVRMLVEVAPDWSFQIDFSQCDARKLANRLTTWT